MGYVELCVRREGRFWRWCARKRLHQEFRSDVRFRTMFMDEARLAGLIRHPNVVGVSDVGEDEDGPFFIMDYVEGVSLGRVIRDTTQAGRPIPVQVAVRICREVASGLHSAHEVRSEDGTILRLVHRDVSPQNILIGFDGTVRVTDFGIAKALGNASHTTAGVLKGNLGYLSPEQLQFEEADRRSDFFSLGVSLYELLSGTSLYPNTDGFDGTRRILFEPPPDIGEVRSDVPDALVELLFEMLAKDREARPAAAVDIARRLDAIIAPLVEEEGAVTVSDFMDQHFALQRQRHRGYLAEHLKRLNEGPPELPTPVVGPVTTARLALPDRRPRFTRIHWALLLGSCLTGILVVRAHPASVGGHAPRPTEVGRLTFPSPPPTAPVPARAEPAPRPVIPPPTPIARAQPDGHSSPRQAAHLRHRSAERRSRGAAHGQSQPGEQARASRAAAGHPELPVPLFTRWR